MSSTYGFRLAILAFASFFAVHLAATVLVGLGAGRLIRHAGRLWARSGARLLFWARVAPAVLPAAIVIGLCVPSFLLHEQRTAAEGVGPACLAAALLGAANCADGLLRGTRALWASSRFVRRAGRTNGLVALAGILRPRLLVSRDVVEILTREQLEAALSHERAHGVSRDNLKQLVVLMTPGGLPGWRVLDSLERGWKQLAEFAADDYAAAGDPRRAVDLATALVRVSRLSSSPRPALAASLLDSCGHLESRVSRLLNGAADRQPASRFGAFAGAAAILAAAFPLIHPAGLLAVHNLLERLIH